MTPLPAQKYITKNNAKRRTKKGKITPQPTPKNKRGGESTRGKKKKVG